MVSDEIKAYHETKVKELAKWCQLASKLEAKHREEYYDMLAKCPVKHGDMVVSDAGVRGALQIALFGQGQYTRFAKGKISQKFNAVGLTKAGKPKQNGGGMDGVSSWNPTNIFLLPHGV